MFGGLLDQAVVSFGNFALSLVLARTLPASAYGTFVAILSFVLLFNLIHQAAVTYPLSIAAAGADPEHCRALLGKAVLSTTVVSLILLVPLGIAMASLGLIRVLPIVFLTMLAWQMQETLRRGLLAQERFSRTIFQDGVRYLGPLIALSFLPRPLAIEDVFLLMLGASLLAILPQITQLRWPRMAGIESFKQSAIADWTMASPAVGANLLAAFSTQWYLWILAWHHDVLGTATLAALANIAALTSPIMLGIENILVPEVARRRQLPFDKMLDHLRGRSLSCVALVLPIYAGILLFPVESLRLVYGHATIYAAYPQALRVLVLAYSTYLANAILSATLRGYCAGRAVFLMQAYPAAFGLVVGGWLTITWGLEGACVAALLTGLLRAAFGVHYLFTLNLRHDDSATTAA